MRWGKDRRQNLWPCGIGNCTHLVCTSWHTLRRLPRSFKDPQLPALEPSLGIRSLTGTISDTATVINPVTIHAARQVNPPQVDAPPFAITAATGTPLIDLLVDLPDIAPLVPVDAAAATAPQLAPGGIYPLNPDGIPITNPPPLKPQPPPMKPPPKYVVEAEAAKEGAEALRIREAQQKPKPPPPMLPQPPTPDEQSDRLHARRVAKADAEAAAYNAERRAKMIKTTKAAATRAESDAKAEALRLEIETADAGEATASSTLPSAPPTQYSLRYRLRSRLRLRLPRPPLWHLPPPTRPEAAAAAAVAQPPPSSFILARRGVYPIGLSGAPGIATPTNDQKRSFGASTALAHGGGTRPMATGPPQPTTQMAKRRTTASTP